MSAACLQAVEEAAATANTADPSPVFTARAEDNQSASTWTGTKRAKLKQVHWSGKERGDEFEADFSFDDTVCVQSVRRLKLRRDMATGYAQCREASCPKPQFGTHRTDSLHSAQKHCRAHHAPEKKATKPFTKHQSSISSFAFSSPSIADMIQTAMLGESNPSASLAELAASSHVVGNGIMAGFFSHCYSKSTWQ